ncbi:MAG TPA: Uma2 family endonuclease, partial [Thermodesulfovibrionia bacterium]|nr:Uma2 family endonuclease [Thermodesulfovibrionia bacterium]
AISNQNIQELLEKAATLVRAGVKTVWTVEPFSRLVFITNEQGDTFLHNQPVEFDNIRVDFTQIKELSTLF